jgi:hypothetical protein
VQALLRHYHAMCEAKDGATRCLAAFSLPAVLQTGGGAVYWPQLAATHRRLCNDVLWSTRRTLAASMHVVARLIAPTPADELLALLEAQLADCGPVQAAAARALAGVLSHCGGDARLRHLGTPAALYAEPIAWRARLDVVQQLPALARLYAPRLAAAHHVPLLLLALRDPVYQVRRAAAAALGPTLHAALLPRDALDRLARLAASPCYTEREVVLLAARADCLRAADHAATPLLPHLQPLVEQLCNDKVLSIKQLAQTLRSQWPSPIDMSIVK